MSYILLNLRDYDIIPINIFLTLLCLFDSLVYFVWLQWKISLYFFLEDSSSNFHKSEITWHDIPINGVVQMKIGGVTWFSQSQSPVSWHRISVRFLWSTRFADCLQASSDRSWVDEQQVVISSACQRGSVYPLATVTTSNTSPSNPPKTFPQTMTQPSSVSTMSFTTCRKIQNLHTWK